MLRSKIAHLLIFIGPLVVISLLGFFYYNDNNYNINVGFYSPQNNSLTQSYVQTLRDNNFKLLTYENKEACEKGLKSGLNHVCIFFPADFKLGKSNQLEILIDSSKSNIDSIVQNLLIKALEEKQQELQLQLTTQVVNTLNENEKQFLELRTQITQLATKNKEISEDSISISNYLTQIEALVDFSDSGVDDATSTSSSLESEIETFIVNVDNYIFDVREGLNDLEDYIDNLSLSTNETAEVEGYIDLVRDNLTDIDVELGTLESSDSINQINASLNSLKNSLDNIESGVSSAISKSIVLLNKNKETISEMGNLISNIENTNEQIIAKVSGVEIKDANKIINTVDFEISSVVPDSTKHLNSIIASLLVGLIMIISLLLSSNLVLIEKKSMAAFRNYMVMSSGFFFLIGNFLTLLFIVMVQISSIILVYYFLFLKMYTIEPLIILLVSIPIICFFILLGIALGNISSNSSSNIILVFIVIFLFMSLSGTILPLEILSSQIVGLSFLNPYLVSEGIIRQILLFDTSITELKFDFIVLGLFILVFFIIAYILEEFSRKRDLYQIFVLVGLRLKNRKHSTSQEKESSQNSKNKVDKKKEEDKKSTSKKIEDKK